MSPEQIDAVATSWAALQTFPRERLCCAIAGYLPCDAPWPPQDRAAWIVRTVDRLHCLLDRPGVLAAKAAEIIDERTPCGPGSLAVEQEALLAGLRDSLDGMDDDVARAWRHACHLFAELIAARTIAPFGELPQSRAAP
jgi:hypothetical protein